MPWLSSRPSRHALMAALIGRTVAFDIHHIDGNHNNNDPLNLILMPKCIHSMLTRGWTIAQEGMVRACGVCGSPVRSDEERIRGSHTRCRREYDRIMQRRRRHRLLDLSGPPGLAV